MVEAIKIINALLGVLPDSIHEGDRCWSWCWDELDNESQELVKTARREAETFISERSE